MLRYGTITKGHKGDLHIERGLTFDDFVHCCIKLKQAIEFWTYQNQEQTKSSSSSHFTPGSSYMKYGVAGYGTQTRGSPSPVPGYSNYGKSPLTTSFTLDEVS